MTFVYLGSAFKSRKIHFLGVTKRRTVRGRYGKELDNYRYIIYRYLLDACSDNVTEPWLNMTKTSAWALWNK